MPDFSNGVATPGGASYMAPLLSFQQFANWPDDYNRGVQAKQQQAANDQIAQIRQQEIQQGAQRAQLAQAFPNGLPTDPSTGQIDYRQVAATLAKFGDVSDAVTMLQQQPPPLSPMFGGPGQAGGQPQPAGGATPTPSAGAPPASVAAKPLPPAAPNAPKGDSGQNTITSLVTDRLPSQNQTTGETIGKIAEVMGIDPNADLTPGQVKRAQGLLQKYAPDVAGVKVADASGRTGGLPPSANAGTPAATPGAAPSFNDRFAAAGGGQSAAAPPAPAAAPAPPAPPAPQPIGAQVPLPKGFSDPQQAALALRAEAARLSQFPRAQGQVQELNNWAQRIEESVKPLAVRPGETLLDARTGQPVYQGNQPTMDAAAIQGAAERYLETGTLPPNMGRGLQGSANANAIQNEAAQIAQQRGIDMATLPAKWQQFKAQQVAIQRFTSGPQGNTIRSFNVLVDHLGTLDEAAQALKNGDIRFFNQWKQNWAANTGSTAPTNFDGVKALVGDEIVKAVVGSAGALADREEVKKDLDRASSPKQLAELVDKYKKLALGQLHGLQKQYETSTGQKNFNDMLLPGTLAQLGGNKGEGGKPADAGSGNVTPGGVTWSVEK